EGPQGDQVLMRRNAMVWLLGGLLVAFPGLSWSQTETTIPEPELPGQKPTTTPEQTTRTNIELRRTLPAVIQAGPVDPKTYMLGPGDLLQVDLGGRVARTVPLEVSPEGKIFLPGSGPIQVWGRSLALTRERDVGV